MLSVKNTLARAALAIGAVVALVATAVPNAGAEVYAYYSPCRDDGGLHVCISDQQHVASLAAVPRAQLNPVHIADAVAYVAVYRVPNSSIGVPCVVATVNTQTSDGCASIGLVRDENSEPIYLFDGSVDGYTPAFAPDPLAMVDVCTAILNANYNGVGINDQPIVTVCVSANALGSTESLPSPPLPTGV